MSFENQPCMKNSVPKLSRRLIILAKFNISCSLAGVYPCYSEEGAQNSVYLKIDLGAQALSRASSGFACNIIVNESIIQKKICSSEKKNCIALKQKILFAVGETP